MSASSQFESLQPTVSDSSQKGNLSNSIPELYAGLPQLSAKSAEAMQSAKGNSLDFGQSNIYVDSFNSDGTHIQSVANAEGTMQSGQSAGQTGSDSAGSSNLEQELGTILTDLTQILQELEGGGSSGGTSGGSSSSGDNGGGCGLGSSSGSTGGDGGTSTGSGSGSAGDTGTGTGSGGSGSDSAAMSIFNTLSDNSSFNMGNPFSSNSESGGDLQALQQLQQASGLSDSDFVNTFNGAFLSSGINNDAYTAGLNAALDGNGQPGGMGDPLNLGTASLSNALQTVQSEDPGATGTQLVNAVVNELTNEDNQAWQQMWGTESAGQAAALLNSSDVGNGINANPSMGATPASEQAAAERMQQMWTALAAAEGENNQSDPYLYTAPTTAQ